MDKISNILKQRADEIIRDESRSTLELVQDELNRFYKNGVVAKKIFSNQVLLIETENAALSSEVFISRNELLKAINSALNDTKIASLRTTVK